MRNKQPVPILSLLIIFAGIAAFFAGRMLNQGERPFDLFGGGGEGDGISILRAPELPATPAEVEGVFVERKDQIIIIEADRQDQSGAEGSPVGVGGGKREEVVVTNETRIYHDTTEPPDRPPSGADSRVLQQTVEEGKLEDLYTSSSLVMVWGHRNGDRVVADVLVYSDLIIQQP
jgi:hypothetical protein